MSVGGNIIQITPETLPSGKEVMVLWVVDGTDETVVMAEPWKPGDGPDLGDPVWWQSGKIYFDNDCRWLTKIGASGSAS